MEKQNTRGGNSVRERVKERTEERERESEIRDWKGL